MAPRHLVLSVAASLVVAALGACGPETESSSDDVTTAAPTTVVTTTTMSTIPAPTTAAGSTVDQGGVAALTFFRTQEAVCHSHALTTGNTPIPVAWFRSATVQEARGDATYVIRDGAGHLLVADPAKGVVYSVGGPEDVLPREYSFGCPETVFLGTLED